MTSETTNTATRRTGSTGFILDSNKPSVISEGFSLIGELTAQGVLHVEGVIKGTVTTESVNIGPTGAIEGEVRCGSLHIKGTFIGEALCQELFIANNALVRGNITYETLSIQRGAYVQGTLTRQTRES